MRRRDFSLAAAVGLGTVLTVTTPGQRQTNQVPVAADRRASTVEPFPGDPHRPRYHFLPPRNWMNDPNGLVYHRGTYHLFYQHNPGAAVWGNMHWGHAVSQDLITWRNLPIALAPTSGGYDKDGVFSGCAIVNGDEPTLIYTGTKPEVQAIATSKDPLLVQWQKYEGNPVIAAPPEGLETTGFRDPFVWKEGSDWRMALGSGIRGRGGCVLLYRSPDLRKWEFVHTLVESSDSALGTMWECPNFFPLGEKHVLLISPIPLRKALWAVGTYRQQRFVPEKWGSLDDGGHFYAPQVFLDSGDRRVMFGWSWEGRDQAAQVKSGWAGVQSLPRVLTLREDGGLRQEPHPLCQRLMRFGKSVKGMPIGEELDAELRQAGIAGNAGRLDLLIEPGDAVELGISFYASLDGAEETRVGWQKDPGRVWVDRQKSSLSVDQDRTEFGVPFVLRKGERLNMTLYLDRSMAEVYINEVCCLTTRVYPTRDDSVGIRLWGGGGKTVVEEVTWRPIHHRTS